MIIWKENRFAHIQFLDMVAICYEFIFWNCTMPHITKLKSYCSSDNSFDKNISWKSLIKNDHDYINNYFTFRIIWIQSAHKIYVIVEVIVTIIDMICAWTVFYALENY